MIDSLESAYVVYRLLSKLTTQFSDTQAYKLGIIDKDGTILRKRNTLKTSQEKSSYTLLDGLVWKLKRLIEKIPGGKSKLATYAAALWLIKEAKHHKFYESNEEILEECFINDLNLSMDDEFHSISVLDEWFDVLKPKNEETKIAYDLPKKTGRLKVKYDNIQEKIEKELYIHEGLSKVLYHYTSQNNILKILESNEFRLSTTLGTGAEQEVNKGKWFYFSMARSLMSSYLKYADAIIKINGEKLGADYHGAPTDYWGPGWKKSPAERTSMDEMEDRVITDKPSIKNAKKYIEEIYLAFNTNSKLVNHNRIEETKLLLRHIVELCKQSNIPVHLFEVDSSTIAPSKWMRTKEKDLSLLDPVGTFEPGPKYTDRVLPDSMNVLIPWIELANTPVEDKDKLSKRASDLVYALMWDYQYQDKRIALRNEIHNYKSSGIVVPLIDVFRKMKVRTVDEFMAAIKEKWIKKP